MGTIDRKIRRFEQIAKADAIKIRNSLITEIDEKINSAMKVAEQEYSREAHEIHIKEIEEAHKEAGYIMSTAQNAALNKVLQKRNEIVDNIFNELERKLTEFTKTEEYKPYFEKKLNEALAKTKEIIGERDHEIHIMLTEYDFNNLKENAEKIIENYFMKEKVTIDECDEKIIGGCVVKIEDLRLKINNTIMSIVDREREIFLQDNDLSL